MISTRAFLECGTHNSCFARVCIEETEDQLDGQKKTEEIEISQGFKKRHP
jgi:hypothetical protein